MSTTTHPVPSPPKGSRRVAALAVAALLALAACGSDGDDGETATGTSGPTETTETTAESPETTAPTQTSSTTTSSSTTASSSTSTTAPLVCPDPPPAGAVVLAERVSPVLATCDAAGVLAALEAGGAWTNLVECPEGGSAPVAAVDKRLLAISVKGNGVTREQVVELIGETGLEPESVGTPVPVDAGGDLFVVPTGSLPDEILPSLPLVDRENDVVVDLDYLHHPSPNYGFRPFDDPTEATTAPAFTTGPGGTSILVVDSPGSNPPFSVPGVSVLGPTVSYEGTTGGTVTLSSGATVTLAAEGAGHGLFVAELADRGGLANDTTLAPIVPIVSAVPTGLAAGPYFTESEVLTALRSATRVGDPSAEPRRFAVINLSLGSAGCAARLALHAVLAAGLAQVAAATGAPVFVASAGNSGEAAHEYPAALADDAVAAQLGAVLGDEPALASLGEHTVAVGSWDPASGAPNCFSNHGQWVEAWAPGYRQVASFWNAPFASWSGTSFSAAVFSGLLAEHTPNHDAFAALQEFRTGTGALAAVTELHLGEPAGPCT